MDYSPPGSSVHAISKARKLEWVAISFSRDLLNPEMELASPALAFKCFTTEQPGKSSKDYCDMLFPLLPGPVNNTHTPWFQVQSYYPREVSPAPRYTILSPQTAHYSWHTTVSFMALSIICNLVFLLLPASGLFSPAHWINSRGLFRSQLYCLVPIVSRSSRDGKNAWKNCTRKVLMNWITTMVWSVTHSQTFWSVKSNGPYEALWSIKLVNAMALQIAVKRREAKSKGEKERYAHLNAEFQRIARRDKKAFLRDQCKKK